MILITKAEAQKIREVFPYAHIRRTCVQKSKRHRYYLTESEKFLRLIADTNFEAAAICKKIDFEREQKRKFRNYTKYHGYKGA